MLSKTFGTALRRNYQKSVILRMHANKLGANQVNINNARYFSSEDAAGKVPEPTQEELEKGRQEWGITFVDN